MIAINSEEKIIKALRHEEMDCIPTFEWTIDQKVIEALCPGCSYEDFAYAMDLDAICVDLDYQQEEMGDGFSRDEWGVLKRRNAEQHAYAVSGPIKTLKDLERYQPPDPCSPDRFKTLEAALSKHQGKKAVILHLNDVLSIPRNLCGMEKLLMSFVEEPRLVQGLVELSVDINLRLAKEAVKRGVKIVYTGDDYAFNGGPLMSPSHFAEMLYPELCRVIQGFKELGLYVIKHTDGNIWTIIDMIIETGIDCLDPIDPLAGMDLAEVKHKYGKKVALKGNVDCAKTLTFGTEAEVIAETMKCLAAGAPGGGYILSSSNSIHSGVKPENYAAMLRTVKEYRTT